MSRLTTDRYFALGIAALLAPTPQPELPAQADRARRGIENLLLALLYFQFATTHLEQVEQTGRWLPIVPMVVQESLQAILFLTRRPSKVTSSRPLDWIVGVAGSFLPLTIRAGRYFRALAIVGQSLQFAGLAVSITALLSLGRSIGIVAANRGVKTGGLYRFVRHPMYVGHLFCLLGYLATYPSARNVVIVAATIVALNVRVVVEERVLMQDEKYREYSARTRYRLVPGVY